MTGITSLTLILVSVPFIVRDGIPDHIDSSFP